MIRRIALLFLASVVFSSCSSLLHPKPLAPTTATYHDGKRSVTIIVPHDPKPSPLLGFVEAIAGPLLSLVGL